MTNKKINIASIAKNHLKDLQVSPDFGDWDNIAQKLKKGKRKKGIFGLLVISIIGMATFFISKNSNLISNNLSGLNKKEFNNNITQSDKLVKIEDEIHKKQSENIGKVKTIETVTNIDKTLANTNINLFKVEKKYAKKLI